MTGKPKGLEERPRLALVMTPRDCVEIFLRRHVSRQHVLNAELEVVHARLARELGEFSQHIDNVDVYVVRIIALCISGVFDLIVLIENHLLVRINIAFSKNYIVFVYFYLFKDRSKATWSLHYILSNVIFTQSVTFLAIRAIEGLCNHYLPSLCPIHAFLPCFSHIDEDWLARKLSNFNAVR